MVNKRMMIEILALLASLLVFFTARASAGSEVWTTVGAVARITASLLIILLLARWNWAITGDRQWVEMMSKAVICGAIAIMCSGFLRGSSTVQSSFISASTDLMFSVGLVGVVLFIVFTFVSLRSIRSHL
jgi:hypothetical protein